MRFSIGLCITQAPKRCPDNAKTAARTAKTCARAMPTRLAFPFPRSLIFAKNGAMTDTDNTTKSPNGANDAADAAQAPSGQNKKAAKGKNAAREERLVEALRANLKRRKQQVRERRAAPAGTAHAGKDETPGDS
ncbi:hypothetical protein [Breoghania sp.]|uniref:hypothetical protein n=1 Tax=Breoghania sp. TaxID=2065378 RepID=UPI00260FB0D0|nr:hypothetical protein [Breoghania sp.]MDJ0933537.1 hypothetical protein [Breoghania sp.]